MNKPKVVIRTNWNVAAAGGLLLGLLYAPDAWAYIDPGAGSYVFQLLIAFFVSAAFVLKTYWRRLWDGLRGLFKGKAKHDERP